MNYTSENFYNPGVKHNIHNYIKIPFIIKKITGGLIYCDNLSQSKLTGDVLLTKHWEASGDTKGTNLRDSWNRQIIIRFGRGAQQGSHFQSKIKLKWVIPGLHIFQISYYYFNSLLGKGIFKSYLLWLAHLKSISHKLTL